MNQAHCFGQRLLSPFQGVMQMISIDHGEAESMDGINWVLYVNHQDIVSHTGMYEVRYGSWSQQNGMKLSMVRGTEKNSVIDRVGQQLVVAVEINSVLSPFPLHDCFECWIVTDDGFPLALIDSVVRDDKKSLNESPYWHPGAAAFKEFQSEYGDAEQLQRLVNERAGRRPKSLWVKREKSANSYCGDAFTDSGKMMKAELFPDRLLLEHWQLDKHVNLVKDYLAWQAPWLLQLDCYDDETRSAIESQAWQRPLLCASQYQQFAKVLDETQLKVVRVQARLMGHDEQSQGVIEAFIQPTT